MKEKNTSDSEIEEFEKKDLDALLEGSERVDVSVPSSGTKSVISIRMDRQTLEALDEYARTIEEKLSTVARGFIVEGLERAGMSMTSDELHKLTRLRMREETSGTIPNTTKNETWQRESTLLEGSVTNVIDVIDIGKRKAK
jgi:hypothetical protein